MKTLIYKALSSEAPTINDIDEAIRGLARHLMLHKQVQLAAHAERMTPTPEPRGARKLFPGIAHRMPDPRAKSPLQAADIASGKLFADIVAHMRYDSFRTAHFSRLLQHTLASISVSEMEIDGAIRTFLRKYPPPLPHPPT